MLDADPRRVKKLKIYVSTVRNGGSHETPRRAGAGQPASPAAIQDSHSELPVTRDASVKLSPDVPPSKATR